MNHKCYGCNTCKSADKPLEGYIRNLPFETKLNVDLVYREFAVDYVQMVLVE